MSRRARCGVMTNSQSEKLDVIDLIITSLAEHEKTIDSMNETLVNLITYLEKTIIKLEKTVIKLENNEEFTNKK
jgi:uncharacterized coiled-coil protein SlyX